MSAKDAGLFACVVREALEGALEPNLAAAVLFEALADEPDHVVPDSPEALRTFMREGLAVSLARQLGPEHAVEVLESVSSRVEAVLGAPTPQRPSQAPTANVHPDEGPVRVLVLSSGPRLASGLTGALGSDAVAPYVAPTIEIATRMLAALRPAVVLVDGEDDAATELAAVIGAGAGEAFVLVWAAHRPAGRAAVELLDGASARVVALTQESGAELLMDYVRSRRAQLSLQGQS